ncbi:MAG: xanthine dehydrogenase family protein [Acidimicrobiales bacterium]|nr:xanthine dehydrogenase family protein [Acidimicrobiales bacterium]
MSLPTAPVETPVGTSTPVIDAAARVTGAIRFAADLERPGMLFGALARSPWPHARIVGVDTAAARAVPGVVTVVTGAELSGPGAVPRYGRVFLDQEVLASGRVRYAGEPVAAVAATSQEAAEEAARAIGVDYERLPAVFDAEQALVSGAPLLFDERPSCREEYRQRIRPGPASTNLASHFRLVRGDVADGFAKAHRVFEDTFRSPAAQHVPLEPHVTLAHFEAGSLTLWSSTQMPHTVRAELAELFSLPQTRVRVIVPPVGGGFGAKGSLRLEPVASILSLRSGHPVKMVLRRDEEFVTVTKHPATVRIKTGVSAEGDLLARQVTAYYNTGAYADVGPTVARNAGCALAGPYRIPNVAIDSYCVWTNLVPAGAFRGLGVPQGAFAYESQMDIIARGLGVDPVELRRRNLLREGDVYATGERLFDLHYEELVDEVGSALEWSSPLPAPAQPAAGGIPGRRRDGRRRGRGIAAVIKATTTPSTSTATARLNPDGSLDILTSSVEMGQGARTVLAQLAAEALHVPYEAVAVSEPDTAATPYDQQTSSSRTTFSMGTAVTRAVAEVRDELLRLAAQLLEASPEDLVTRSGRVEVRGVPTRSCSYAEVVRRSRRGNLLGHGELVTEGGLDLETGQGRGSVHWHHGVSGCEVEVDTETGLVEVRQVAAAVYAGRVVNPRLCELQVEGSTIFGLGLARFEEIVYEDGQVTNPNLSDYRIPSFGDVPARLSVRVLEREGGEVHGIGETALPPVMPAIANAIEDAVGVRITELPITAEKVLSALSARAAGGST